MIYTGNVVADMWLLEYERQSQEEDENDQDEDVRRMRDSNQ